LTVGTWLLYNFFLHYELILHTNIPFQHLNKRTVYFKPFDNVPSVKCPCGRVNTCKYGWTSKLGCCQHQHVCAKTYWVNCFDSVLPVINMLQYKTLWSGLHTSWKCAVQSRHPTINVLLIPLLAGTFKTS
jgi:hypothetical protein